MASNTNAAGGVADVRRMLDSAPMSRTQVVAVGITGALSALDGYDVLSITFAAPAISLDWKIGRGALGLVLSSSLVGMALGSLLLAPIADRVGRKRMVLVNLALMALGMLMSAFTGSVGELAFWRVVTGLGIGSMVPIIAPLAAEFANERRRGLAIAIMSIGYPLGGMLGAAIAAILLRQFGWPSIFILGGAFALLLIPIVLAWLPESPAFLGARSDPRSMTQMNAFLARCGLAPVTTQASPSTAQVKAPMAYVAIFDSCQRATTIRVMAINFLFMMTTYFFLSWMPQMIADRGFSPADASSIAAIANLAGVLATVLVGIAFARVPLRPFTAALMIGFGGAVTFFGWAPSLYSALVLFAILALSFLHAGILSLHLLNFRSFPPEMRATGTGFVLGVGRCAGAIAPAAAGALFSAGLPSSTVATLMAVAALVAGSIVVTSRRE